MADARILLVEDDDLNQMLVRTVLARSADPVLRSACLVQAASLAEARTALASSAIDVVLLDMNLPDGNGLSLAAEVQRTGSGGPAVVALTGAGPEQGDAALAAGLHCRPGQALQGGPALRACLRCPLQLDAKASHVF